MDDKQSPAKDQANIEEATSPLSSSPSHSNHPASIDASAFLSPQVKHNTSNQFDRSNSIEQQDANQADALEPSNTPLLNGENIVLLSFSNDNTPVATNQSSPTKEQAPLLQNVTLGESRAESPPADSIHSGQITTLSPPPLSQKSSGSAPTASGRQATGIFSSNGSQGMYTKDVNQNHPPPTVSSHNNPPSIGGRKQRPPLPPRGAFPGMNYQPGVAVDVLPSHLPPPKQIGSVSHRRVVSTGDVSHISVLTDGDSVADVLEESPPTMEAAAAAVAGLAGPASTTGIPSNPSMFGAETRRERGVSWDFGAGGRGDEEPATFEGLGIMQPVLSEEDLAKLAMEDVELLQPVLTTDPEPHKTASDGVIELGKVKGWDKLRANRKAVTQLGGGVNNSVHISSRAFSKKDGSEFEDEAERAILAALGIHNMSQAQSAEKEANPSVEASPGTPKTPDDTVGVEIPSFVSPNLQSSQHRKNVSSMTNLEPVESSPVPLNIHNLHQKGDLLFEDQGWHDGYDALGRTKGSLREEQDAKIMEEVFGSELQTPTEGEENVPEKAEQPPLHPVKKSKFTGTIKPLTMMRAKTDGAASKNIAFSKKKKDDDYEASDDDEEEDLFQSHHVRSKTAISDMAQEMAKYKTAAGAHNRIKTNVSKDSHGVNNLLDGADLLFKVEEKNAINKEPKSEEEEGAEDHENHEHAGDEEMGDANPKHKRAHFMSGTRRSSNRGDYRSEKKNQLRRWYVELLKPKVSTNRYAVVGWCLPGFANQTYCVDSSILPGPEAQHYVCVHSVVEFGLHTLLSAGQPNGC